MLDINDFPDADASLARAQGLPGVLSDFHGASVELTPKQ
jgi:hypothetical protein